MTAITLLQTIKPLAKAKLLLLDGNDLAWNTNFTSDTRRGYHSTKMQSKIARPAAQLDTLMMNGGMVRHIDARSNYRKNSTTGSD